MNNYANKYVDGVGSQASGSLKGRRFVRSAALSCLGRFVQVKREPVLRCIFCHYVFDDQVDAFERLILAVKEMGRFVTTSECLDMIEGRRPIDEPCYHLSFDDGFKNIMKNAMPVLKKHGVPSLVFVPSAFVGASYEEVSYYCKSIAGYSNPIEMVSWQDLRDLVAEGVDVGSHTATHARYSDISCNAEKMEAEFFGSKEKIELELGIPCQTISWPYGQLKDADKTSLSAVKEFGYRACFGAFRGSIVSGGCDPFMIPRHHVEAQWPLAHVRYFVQGNKEAKSSKIRNQFK